MSGVSITEETWWQREIVTDELDEACDAIAAKLRIPRSAVGTKGNERHLRGHHRSQEWIVNSDYCTNRTYTVQPGLTADQTRHIAGIDIVPGVWGTVDNRRKTAEITARVIAAMKAGDLDEVLEVYGAAPDLQTVTGYNNRENRAASSDSSHLDHPHLGIDRRKLRDRAFLARLVAIVTGDDMTPEEHNDLVALASRVYALLLLDPAKANGRVVAAGQLKDVPLIATIKQLVADVAEMKGRPPVQPAPVDPEQMRAVLTDPAWLAALVKAVNDDAAARLQG